MFIYPAAHCNPETADFSSYRKSVGFPITITTLTRVLKSRSDVACAWGQCSRNDRILVLFGTGSLLDYVHELLDSSGDLRLFEATAATFADLQVGNFGVKPQVVVVEDDPIKRRQLVDHLDAAQTIIGPFLVHPRPGWAQMWLLAGGHSCWRVRRL